ncbi:hypothetical protein C1646_771278 [Rhizophagus diaphanus]|nr:hypothetical protein C1646_771278 [Rhizophagus diaphanus] [Rhizophagus sp. MUCL 43196]
MSYYRNNPNELSQPIIKEDKIKSNMTSSKIFTSKIHNFENLPEPKNATEEEQKAFYTTRSYGFSISGNYVQSDYEREKMQQRSNISIGDEVQNNLNILSE